MVMQPFRCLVLLCAPALLLAGCSQAPAPAPDDMQARLAAAEARAAAAEKRARDAEALAADQHHLDAAAAVPPPAMGVDMAQDGGEFGQPMNDTAPIEPVPAVPAETAISAGAKQH